MRKKGFDSSQRRESGGCQKVIFSFAAIFLQLIVLLSGEFLSVAHASRHSEKLAVAHLYKKYQLRSGENIRSGALESSLFHDVLVTVNKDRASADRLQVQAERRDDPLKHNIVPDYPERELVNLSLPSHLKGFAVEPLTLTARTWAKYGVKQVVWDYSALIAAGGQVIESHNATLVVILPAYQHSGNPLQNQYIVKAIAYDVKGNLSRRAETLIEVLPAQVRFGEAMVSDKSRAAPASAFSVLLRCCARSPSVSPVLLSLFSSYP